MENGFIYQLLVDPITGDALELSKDRSYLSTRSGRTSYEIIDGVPKILVVKGNTVGRSDLHKNNNSDFNYQEHYEVDSKLFDYSEKNESNATKHEIRRLHESIVRHIKKKSALILDVGCGNGWVASALVPCGHRVISMDISLKNPLDSVKITNHPNHAGLISDVYNIPFSRGTFDYIIASEIMEHLPDPLLFVETLVKILKQNGKLLITTPYNEKIEYCLCVHCNRMTPRHAHLNSFNERNIDRLLKIPGTTYKTSKFSNKFLSRLRFHIILKHLPFFVWNKVDQLFNFLFQCQTRLKIELTKEND